QGTSAFCGAMPVKRGDAPGKHNDAPAKCRALPAKQGVAPAKCGVVLAFCGVVLVKDDATPAKCGIPAALLRRTAAHGGLDASLPRVFILHWDRCLHCRGFMAHLRGAGEARRRVPRRLVGNFISSRILMEKK